jgi:hypothetical protein
MQLGSLLHWEAYFREGGAGGTFTDDAGSGQCAAFDRGCFSPLGPHASGPLAMTSRPKSSLVTGLLMEGAFASPPWPVAPPHPAISAHAPSAVNERRSVGRLTLENMRPLAAGGKPM